MTGQRVAGVDYSSEGVEDVRRGLIEIRAAAMKVPHWDAVVLLSHAIALLADYADSRRLVEADKEAHHAKSPASPAGSERVETMEGRKA